MSSTIKRTKKAKDAVVSLKFAYFPTSFVRPVGKISAFRPQGSQFDPRLC